ncbi:MAG: hypothetical protein AAGE84_08955 [Cyanobacteria bacterium P01_G01_bin.39]
MNAGSSPYKDGVMLTAYFKPSTSQNLVGLAIALIFILRLGDFLI